MDRKSEVYISQKDKDRLQELITEIGSILEQYPYSDDYSEQFLSTMTRAKSTYEKLDIYIDLLSMW